MPVAPVRLFRFSLLLFALVVASAWLAGCDAAGPADELEAPPAESDGLRLVPIPSGAELIPLGGDSPIGASPTPGAATNNSASTRTFPEGASAYGCLISTLDPDGEPYAYRYEQVYLHFPKGVLKQADGEVKDIEMRLHTKTLYAEEPRSEAVVGRWARCRIPAAEAATGLLQEHLKGFRKRDAGESGHNEQAASSKEAVQHGKGATQVPGGVKTNAVEKVCLSRIVWHTMVNGEAFTTATCVDWKYVESDDPPSGGGGGEDPDQCTGSGSGLGAEGPGGEICAPDGDYPVPGGEEVPAVDLAND